MILSQSKATNFIINKTTLKHVIKLLWRVSEQAGIWHSM